MQWGFIMDCAKVLFKDVLDWLVNDFICARFEVLFRRVRHAIGHLRLFLDLLGKIGLETQQIVNDLEQFENDVFSAEFADMQAAQSALFETVARHKAAVSATERSLRQNGSAPRPLLPPSEELLEAIDRHHFQLTSFNENTGEKGGLLNAFHLGQAGSEVGIEEYRKNLTRILREFGRNVREDCMYFWYFVYEILTKFLVNSNPNTHCPLLPQVKAPTTRRR
jgi:hypothetical protein